MLYETTNTTDTNDNSPAIISNKVIIHPELDDWLILLLFEELVDVFDFCSLNSHETNCPFSSKVKI